MEKNLHGDQWTEKQTLSSGYKLPLESHKMRCPALRQCSVSLSRSILHMMFEILPMFFKTMTLNDCSKCIIKLCEMRSMKFRYFSSANLTDLLGICSWQINWSIWPWQMIRLQFSCSPRRKAIQSASTIPGRWLQWIQSNQSLHQKM